MKEAERSSTPRPPTVFPLSPLLLPESKQRLTPEQVLALYGTVYGDLSLQNLDMLLSFELADTLNGNFYHVDRDIWRSASA
jgi:hypothetical protein